MNDEGSPLVITTYDYYEKGFEDGREWVMRLLRQHLQEDFLSIAENTHLSAVISEITQALKEREGVDK